MEAHSRWNSASDPSHQKISLGWQSVLISSTQRASPLCSVMFFPLNASTLNRQESPGCFHKTAMEVYSVADMAAAPQSKSTEDTSQTKCLARSVMEAFTADPAIEAVTIDPSRQMISVATLGNTRLPQATDRVRQTIQRSQQLDRGGRCTLLTGTGSCTTCDNPLSDEECKRITIRREGAATTIARVTCPTAPSFWRWRQIPLPKVGQRDGGFLEGGHPIDEWKAQLLAAALCGVFGLAGYFARAPLIS